MKNPKTFNVSLTPVNLSKLTIFLVAGTVDDVCTFVNDPENVDNKQNVFDAGHDADLDHCYVFFLEDTTTDQIKDLLNADDIKILNALKPAGMNFTHYVAANGDGKYVNICERGMFGSKDQKFTRKTNYFLLRLNETLFDQKGFVKGDPNNTRDVNMLARDILRGIRTFDVQTNKFADIAPHFAGKTTRHTMTAFGLIELEKDGTILAGLAWQMIDRHLTDNTDLKWSVSDLKKKIDGVFEDISCDAGKNMLIATTKNGATRFQGIQVLNDIDTMTFVPTGKLVATDEVDKNFGAIRRIGNWGAMTTITDNGNSKVGYYGFDTLPKALQTFAAQLN